MLNNARIAVPVTTGRGTAARSHRMAVALGYARGRLQWLHPEARRRSRLAVAAIAGARADDRMAQAHLQHAGARDQLLRLPAIMRGALIEGGHHLRAAKATGRGVLVSYCHFGPFPAIGVTTLELVSDVHQVVGAWLAAPRPDSVTPRVQRWRRMFDEAGVPLISSEGCFPVVNELLRRGAVVVMAFDWPGSVESRFLGKPVRLAAGTARLAEASGALVVPVMRRFEELRLRTTFGAPLGPAAPGEWRQLHDDVAARHEHWILQCPAALEDPRRVGAWEEAATPESWGLPIRLQQPFRLSRMTEHTFDARPG